MVSPGSIQGGAGSKCSVKQERCAQKTVITDRARKSKLFSASLGQELTHPRRQMPFF